MTGSRNSFSASARIIVFVFLFLIVAPGQRVIAQPNGETLFKNNCAQCHSTGDNKVVGPGLKGIDQRRDEEWLLKWVKNSQAVVKSGDEYAVKLFNDFGKVVMPSVNLKDDEIKAILAYVKEQEKAQAAAAPAEAAGTETAPEAKQSDWGLWLFIFVLFILAILLNRVRKGLEKALLIKEGKPVPESVTGKVAIKRWVRGNKKLIAVLLLIGFAWGSYKGWYALAGIGISQDYAPDQPIKFSHKIHAGQDKIDCKYCHSGAEKGKSAGIPSANVCMNCHKYIQEGPKYGKQEIAKIYASLDYDASTGNYGNNPKPTQWIRVHNLPDLAYFNHAQHVKVGKIECQTCHGPVEEMEVLKQFSPLTMGWCIDCHRKTEVKMDGNAYYDDYHRKLMEKYGPDTKITVEKIGGTECSRCHY